jgi:hypothetical protein
MRYLNMIAFAAILAVGANCEALAQAPAPAASETAPAAKHEKMGAADKAALSKKCSAEADAKGLHGKARKKFRGECKKGQM